MFLFIDVQTNAACELQDPPQRTAIKVRPRKSVTPDCISSALLRYLNFAGFGIALLDRYFLLSELSLR
jgi:hypothetical protein